MHKGNNVFVKIDKYNDILDIIALINQKVREARVILGKINDLKNQEDSELDAWKNSLDDVERKLKYIDQTLFEPKY
jgi:flagellar hook-associated protein FlgK